MAKQDLTKECDGCGGIGSEGGNDPETGDPISTPCTKCNGMKVLLLASLDQDLVGDIETIKDKVDWLKKNVKEILQHFNIQEK